MEPGAATGRLSRRDCQGTESAGRQHGGKTRKGNVHLKTAVVTAAINGGRKRGSYLAEKYRRLQTRRGKMRAAVAIAHKILVTAYHMLARQSDYQELGAGYLDQLNRRRAANHLTRRLHETGYNVQITPKAA